MAIWVYNMTVETGHFAVLRRSFGTDLRGPAHPGRDHRVLLRRADGGARRLRDARRDHRGDDDRASASSRSRQPRIALVANTAPVAFGAIATPIITLSEITELDKGDLGSMVGRQTPFLALIVPLILIGMVDGRRGIRQAWPVAVVGGLSFAVGQFAVLELPLRRADGHRRRAAGHRRDRRLPAHLDAGRAAARRDAPSGRFARPAAAGGSVHDPVMERRGQSPRRHRRRPARRRRSRLRALRDHHRDLLDRADPGGQGLARRVALDHDLRVARPRRAQSRRRGRSAA